MSWRWAKALCWVAVLAPAAWLILLIVEAQSSVVSPLGADPAEFVVRYLGEWGMRALLASLLVSTLARRFKRPQIIQLRRLIGVSAFVYLTAHVIGYVWLFAGAQLSEVINDLFERTYITVGFLGWLVLLPLAITSTRGWQRRLGLRWKKLHRLVYVAVVAGCVHYWWLTKDGYGEVVVYCCIAAALLAERWFARRRLPRAAAAS